MSRKDPRIDAYIASAPDFAKPILVHLRKLAHVACPDVEETMKWRMPHFLHKGILFGMAAFKQHCSVNFWKGALILGEGSRQVPGGGLGQFGRIITLSDLPSKNVLLTYIKKAVDLNDAGIKKEPSKPRPKAKLLIPKHFAAALNKNSKARATFENFSYSHKREYLEWITEAKREETRSKRIATTIEWLNDGKPRNWKYLNC